MELQGQVIEVIYQNEINGYMVCELLLEKNKTIVATGCLPFINLGDSLKVYGKYITHQEYGEQFKIDTFEKILPQTIEALERYLSGGIVKGIGPVMAKKIIEKFKDETLAVFKFEPSRLAEIKGISEKKALEIAEEFNEKTDLWQIVGFLEKFGISAANSKKVYKELGKDAIKKIEENPYILIDITYGVDFKQIDRMALEFGFDNNNEKRIESAIKYSLALITYNGHTCSIQENLITFVKELINVEEEHIENALITCKVNQSIVIEEQENYKWVYLYPFYKAEENIKNKIINLLNSNNIKKISNIKKRIKEFEEKEKYKLSTKQKETVDMVNDNNVCIITGGPGTGKTTIIKTILELYKNEKRKVVLCAPTGRAAKRITEQTGYEAKTIHRLLEIGKIDDDKNINIDYDIAPIDADIIIIDEVSMVDMFIMNYILKGVFLGTKLILVGDNDQLPSVGPGNVLKDLINSNKIPTIYLDKIFRQAAKSKIIINAHNVNEGKMFLSKENENKYKEDFFYIKENNQDKILYNVLSLAKERLKKYFKTENDIEIQVLTPTKKGMLGTKELNNQLQKSLNPEDENKKEKKHGEKIFRQGDRIMQIKNNYDIYWEKEETKENGTGIFNGELGNIADIYENEKQLKAIFDDGKIVYYNFTELDELELAYAITIHKSQGSEFSVVIIVISQAAPMLLTRNLLYTGITRAKDMLVVIGNNNIVEYMINNVDSKKRNTGLEYKFKS